MPLSLPVDGFRLAYDRHGHGAAAVLLHGWPGDRSDFDELVEHLDADIVVPDLRGFGESDKHSGGDYSAQAQGRSVVSLMDELGIERAVLAGYDVGSRVAQLMAQEYPERVDALVVAPPLPGLGRRVLDPAVQSQFWYTFFHQLALADELIDGRRDAVRAYLRHFWTHWSGPAFTLSDERLDHLAERYGAVGAFTASIGWYRSGPVIVARALAEQPPAERVAVPTTVLWPEFDPLAPRAWSDRLDEWYSNIDLRHLDRVGHFSPVEAPSEFAAAISHRLRQ
jgi:pimeloyl-ACP methyl ester carboxylesterase